MGSGKSSSVSAIKASASQTLTPVSATPPAATATWGGKTTKTTLPMGMRKGGAVGSSSSKKKQ
jgi:hypothetical protein